MKEQFKAYSIEYLFLSFFGAGYAPYAPGTVGSLCALPLLYLCGRLGVPVIFLIPGFILILIGACLVTDYIQRKEGLHDPSWIVIDEVIGMFTAFFFVPTSNFVTLTLLFIFFRFFDIVKIWPASYFDKKMKHGAGVILDDVVSGIYAGLATLLVHQFVLNFFYD